MTKVHRFGAVLALIMLGACKNDDVDLGGGTSAPPTVAGKWRGYMEGSARGSADDDIHLDLAVDGDKVTGVVTFTTAPPPPPVGTDKDAPYPPDAYGPGKPADAYRRGFRFTVRDGVVNASRARFWISFVEVFAGWCALQDSFLVGGTVPYGCLPRINSSKCTSTGVEFATEGQPVTASFFRAQACGGLDACLSGHPSFAQPMPPEAADVAFQSCDCDATHCVGRASEVEAGEGYRDHFSRHFDLNLNGDRLDGAGFHFVRE